MLLLDQGQRLQGAAGSPAVAAAAAADVQGLGPAVEPMPALAVEPGPGPAVEPEPRPVVEPVGPAQPAETVPGHLVDHLLAELGLPLQVVSLLLLDVWLLQLQQGLSLVASCLDTVTVSLQWYGMQGFTASLLVTSPASGECSCLRGCSSPVW